MGIGRVNGWQEEGKTGVTHPLQKTKPQRVGHPGGTCRTKGDPPAAINLE
jgi:hypothetical protein